MAKNKREWKLEYDDYGDEIWFGGDGCGMWTIETGNDHNVEIYLSGNNDNSPYFKAKSKANALLVVSAPDLLEACKAGRDMLLNLLHTNNDIVIKKLESAIRKAEGGK